MSSRREKLLFYLLLGVLSTVGAEVVSGASPFPLFTPTGLLVVLPVYLLHAVFFFAVVSWSGQYRFSTIYLAGVLFGLYEAYIMKVVWDPYWDPLPVAIGGVQIIETAMLILFWHPVAAFIVPLAAAELLLTRTSFVVDGVPERVARACFERPRAASAAFVALALVLSISRPNTAVILLSLVANGVVVLALVGYWRRRIGGTRYGLDDFVPTRREFSVIAALLGLLYLVLGVSIRPESIPPFVPGQLVVVGLYLVFAGLLVANLRRARNLTTRTRSSAAASRRRRLFERRVEESTIATSSRYALGFLVLVAASNQLYAVTLVPIYLAFVVTTVVLGAMALGHAVGDTRAMGDAVEAPVDHR